MLQKLLSTTSNKILLAIMAFGLLLAVVSPLLLASPQCTTEANQPERDAVGCIMGADFGPGMGIVFGIGSAATASALALILETAWFKKLSFLGKFFLLIPFVMVLLFCLPVIVGLFRFGLEKQL